MRKFLQRKATSLVGRNMLWNLRMGAKRSICGEVRSFYYKTNAYATMPFWGVTLVGETPSSNQLTSPRGRSKKQPDNQTGGSVICWGVAEKKPHQKSPGKMFLCFLPFFPSPLQWFPLLISDAPPRLPSREYVRADKGMCESFAGLERFEIFDCGTPMGVFQMNHRNCECDLRYILITFY